MTSSPASSSGFVPERPTPTRPTPMSPLSAQVVTSIGDLELVARLVVEGMRAGRHRSPLLGFSAEFSRHRPYQPGDDLKHLDWKLLARTDRLYTRRFHERTNLSLMLVVDSSASMDFPEGEATKLRSAVVLAAALAHLVSTGGDSVGLTTRHAGEPLHLPARGGRPHLRALLARLDRLEPAGTFDTPAMIERAANVLRRPGLLLLISDLYDDEEAIRSALARAVRRGHDVAVLHLLDPAERELALEGELLFEDAETGERRIVDTRTAAPRYGADLEAFLERTRDAARREGIDLHPAWTDTPPSTLLRSFLLARRGAG